jgi:uncharacterized membrane protein
MAQAQAARKTPADLERKTVAAAVGILLLAAISLWALVPLAALLAARVSRRLPPPYDEAAERTAVLTFYATLPAAILGVLFSLFRAIASPGDALALTVRIYTWHHWLKDQVWLEPEVLVPAFVLAGGLSVWLARPGPVAALGRAAQLAGRATLAIYVLSLFSFVAPGPVTYHVDTMTAEQRDRLKVRMALNLDAEKQYLSDGAIAASLSDQASPDRTGIVQVVAEVAKLAQRFGCNRNEETMCTCPVLQDFAHTFAEALPPPDVSPATPAASDDRQPPAALPDILRASAQADEAAETIDKRREAMKTTLDNAVASIADWLPFGSLATASIGEIAAAVSTRYGDTLITRMSALTPAAERAAIAGVPAAIAQAAAWLRDAVAQRGALVLVLGLGASADLLDLTERNVQAAESRLRPGQTIMDLARDEARAENARLHAISAGAVDRPGERGVR